MTSLLDRLTQTERAPARTSSTRWAEVSTTVFDMAPIGGPSPSAPSPSHPQHFTRRSAPVTAQKKFSPPSTMVTSFKPRTSSGAVMNLAVLPVASLPSPSPLYPQQTTLPVLLRAQAANAPAAILTASVRFRTSTGVGLASCAPL